MAFTTQYPLRFTNLDQSAQKQAFIDYLKTTSEFQNFNFNASGISSLLDLLSYQSYHQSLMANFAFNEMFLSTATKRANVVARAAEMGYTPSSAHSSQVQLSVIVTNVTGTPTSLTLPANSIFASSVNGSSYNFATLVPYSANLQYNNIGQAYYQFTITAYEGLFSQNSTVLSSTNTFLLIPNVDVDTTTLRTFVTLNITEYEFYTPKNFLVTTPSEYVYFLAETLQGWKVSFGDGTFGYNPPYGSNVRTTYMLTSGAIANGCSSFTFTGSFAGSSGALFAVSAVLPSQGGADAETIDSIKINAPNAFTTQDRAVTANDYKVLIKQSSNNIKDIQVWGGQDNVPPMFGKVVACVEPNYGDTLTSDEISNLQTIVAGMSVPNIQIVFVPPTYMNLIINTQVTYDSSVLTLSTFDLQNLVQSTIATFISSQVSSFNGTLRMSNLQTVIDSADVSIISDVTNIKLQYQYSPSLYQTTGISFSFENELASTNVGYVMQSSIFYVPGQSTGVWVQDDAKGNLNLLYSTSTGQIAYQTYNIGTINYATGQVMISSILITGIVGSYISFTTQPNNTDLLSQKQTILVANSNNITVSAIAKVQ
jgi:hypothetical protein